MEILDTEIAASADLEQVRLCVQIGLLCVQGDPHQRPAMRRVAMLHEKTRTSRRARASWCPRV